MMLMPCQKKKKQKMIQNQKEEENMSVDYYNNAVTVVDDDVVVTQILSRLPAKSLMRCKCVCKGWKSIIEHDSHFINLYHTRSQARPVLLITPDPDWNWDFKRPNCNSFSADLEYDDDGDNVTGANLRTLRRLNMRHNDERQLGPAGGLLCLVDRLFGVQIYNVSTGQVITPWIKSTGSMDPHEYSHVYNFGFDPRTGKHKVVHVLHSNNYKAQICKVLTVGDNRWRIIDDAPPCRIQGNASTGYANGSVYWIVNAGRNLVAFDVGPEKFRIIPIPEFTFMEFPPGHSVRAEFMEMDGFPTVVRRSRTNDGTLKMWKFHDHNKENGTEEEEEHWSEVKVTLPSYIHVPYTYFHPVPEKDQMIIETYSLPGANNYFRRNVNLAHFYSYNLTKNTMSKFEIQGISSVPDDCWTQCSTLVESLRSVAES